MRSIVIFSVRGRDDGHGSAETSAAQANQNMELDCDVLAKSRQNLRGWKTYLKQSSDNETYLAVNDIHGFVNASEHRADCIVGLDFST